jgi:uncharacterized protein YdeI (YjbR/CyaY-like superfamily)
MAELEVKQFASPTNWNEWLAKNHNQPDGVWLKFAKKNSGEKTINHQAALEAALCYGWIDAQAKTFDEKFYLIKFTPRRPKSVWSKINVEKVEKLIAEGKMKPAGIAQVEAAKADGRWERAYLPQSTAELPGDFKTALAKNKKAAEFFESLNKANKYAFIWRLHHVKKPETRAKNIEKYIEMLADGEKFHQ